MAHDNKDAHSRKLDAAGLILCDAIAAALEGPVRVRLDRPNVEIIERVD